MAAAVDVVIKSEDSGNEQQQLLGVKPNVVAFASVLEAIQPEIDSEKLAYLALKGWILFLREDFDVFLGGEPHHAMSYVYHVDSKRYLSRVWGKTLKQGKASD